MHSYWTTTTGWAPSRRCRVTLRCGPWSGITVSPTRRFSAVTVRTQYVMVAAFLPGGVGSQGFVTRQAVRSRSSSWQARGNANPDGQWTHATPIDQDTCDPVSVNRPQDRRSGGAWRGIGVCLLLRVHIRVWLAGTLAYSIPERQFSRGDLQTRPPEWCESFVILDRFFVTLAPSPGRR